MQVFKAKKKQAKVDIEKPQGSVVTCEKLVQLFWGGHMCVCAVKVHYIINDITC